LRPKLQTFKRINITIADPQCLRGRVTRDIMFDIRPKSQVLEMRSLPSYVSPTSIRPAARGGRLRIVTETVTVTETEIVTEIVTEIESETATGIETGRGIEECTGTLHRWTGWEGADTRWRHHGVRVRFWTGVVIDVHLWFLFRSDLGWDGYAFEQRHWSFGAGHEASVQTCNDGWNIFYFIVTVRIILLLRH